MALRCLAVVGEAEAATTVWTFVLRLLPCYGDDGSLVSVKLVRLVPGACSVLVFSKIWPGGGQRMEAGVFVSPSGLAQRQRRRADGGLGIFSPPMFFHCFRFWPCWMSHAVPQRR
jgi:hypothetical protein